MEYTLEEYQRNKVTFDCSKFLEPFSYMTERDIQFTENPSYVNEYKLISWIWSKAFETNNASTFILQGSLTFENVTYQNKNDETKSTSDEMCLILRATNALKSGFNTRHGTLIPSNIHSVLRTLIEPMRDCVNKKLYFIHLQEYIILLPSRNIEYASKFYSLQKIDSYFNKLDFKNSSILESFKLFPVFEDIRIYLASRTHTTDENNLIFSSSPTNKNKLNFLDNKKRPDSVCSDLGATFFASKSRYCSETKSSGYHMLNLKSPSVKSDYTVDLIKTHKQICFPMKRCTKEFRKHRKIPLDKLNTIFPKKKQCSASALYRNHRCSKRNCFVKDSNRTKADDYLPFYTKEDDDELDICSIQEKFKNQKLSGKRVASKIAEIRQRVENLSREVTDKLNQREQYHQSFIEQCKRICDSTISFHDYDEIYHTESSRNSTIGERVFSSDENCEHDLSEHRTVNYRHQFPFQSKPLNSSVQVPKRNGTSVLCCQALNQSEVSKSRFQFLNESRTANSCGQALNQSEASNSRFQVLNESRTSNSCRQALKKSETLDTKYPRYLNIIFEDLPHYIAVVLGTISVPFVASLFVKN